MKIKSHIVNLVLLIILIMCVGYEIAYYNEAKFSKKVSYLYVQDSNIDVKSMQKYLKDEEVDNRFSFVGFKEESNGTAYNMELGKNTECNVIYLVGNSNVILNNTSLYLDDSKGCIVDKKVAYALFGDYNVKGLTITYNDNEYTIRNVVDNLENAIVIEGDSNSNIMMDIIAVESDDESYTEEFMNKYGINAITSDNNIYYRFAEGMSCILLIIILIIFLYKLIRIIIKDKDRPIKQLIDIAIIIIVCMILYKVVDFNFTINYNLIPNEWSDFDYWGEMIRKYSEKYKSIMLMQKYNIEIFPFINAAKSIACGIISIVLFWTVKNRIKVDNLKKLYLLIVLTIIIEFIVIIIVNKNYELNSSRIIYLFPYYFAINYFLDKKLRYYY